MFCSASFNKRCLLGINFSYIIAAFILIGVASYAKHANIAETLPVVGGIIACGVFLLFVAILGLVATLKQSQSLMFYYMIIIGVIFILQFFISIACLGIKKERETTLVKSAWTLIDDPSPPAEIHTAEQSFGCCGLDYSDQRRNATKYNITSTTTANCTDTGPSGWCREIQWCITTIDECKDPADDPNLIHGNITEFGCPTCTDSLDSKIDKAFNATGGLGLFFSFAELIAILAAFVYRKQCANLTTIA